jgi:integrase
MGLTDLSIKKMKPKEKRYEVTDGKGLVIRVTPAGKKTWFYRYMFDGVPRVMAFGEYPGVTLAEARIRHGKAMLDIQQGTDPGLKAKEAKTKTKASPTFENLFSEFWEIELKEKPSGKEQRRLVKKDALPGWKKRKVVTITRRDAVLLIDNVRKRAPVTANRLLGVLVRMMNFACERGILDFNPLAGMRRKQEPSRSRVLTDDEIKIFWNCLDLERTNFDIYRLTKLALKVILLTGQRPGEVTSMKWDQIDGDMWIIPKELRKNNEENRVPILPMLADVINTARIYSGDSRYVFRSSHNQRKPVTVGALANSIRRHSAEMGITERFTPHDLRRTLRTRLAEVGVSDAIAERVMGHKAQGIQAVYNRYSYDAEKQQALALWEKRLREIVLPAGTQENIIQLSEVRTWKK